MDTGLSVALSSQVALERRLATLANNVANSNTTGFQSSYVRFEQVLDGVGKGATAFVSPGATFTSGVKGAIEETGRSLDFALKGQSWFAAQTDAGTIVTRDGRFRMDEAGGLVTLEGHAVLDPGATPIQLNPAGGPISVGADGAIRQDGAQVGALGLFAYQPGADFRRFGSSGIIAETPPVPIVDIDGTGVIQGYLEKSNVNAVAEMSKLIAIHRAFDNTAALIRDTENALETAIKVLGGSST